MKKQGFKDIKILRIIKTGVTTPNRHLASHDAKYTVPFELSDVPPDEWATSFRMHCDHLERSVSLHPIGEISVIEDRITLSTRSIDDLKDICEIIFEPAVKKANEEYRNFLQKEYKNKKQRERFEEEDKQKAEEVIKYIKFE